MDSSTPPAAVAQLEAQVEPELPVQLVVRLLQTATSCGNTGCDFGSPTPVAGSK